MLAALSRERAHFPEPSFRAELAHLEASAGRSPHELHNLPQFCEHPKAEQDVVPSRVRELRSQEERSSFGSRSQYFQEAVRRAAEPISTDVAGAGSLAGPVQQYFLDYQKSPAHNR